MVTDAPPTDPNRLEALEVENAELRKRLEKLESDKEVMADAGRGAGWLARYVLVGPDLVKAFEGWLRAKSIADPLPARETALLGAAVVRRVIRVSMVGLAVAILPTALLFWQNWEIRRQSELFRVQIERQTDQHAQSLKAQSLQLGQQVSQLRQQTEQHDEAMDQQSGLLEQQKEQLEQQSAQHAEAMKAQAKQLRQQADQLTQQTAQHKEAIRVQENQIKQQVEQLEEQRQEFERQARDTEIVRRAQLLATIYDCAEEQPLDSKGRPPELCKPAAHPRAIVEAIKSFVEIETTRGVRVDLREVNLSDFDLANLDILRGVDLSNADLRNVNLSGADLRDVKLQSANLNGANLRGADLSCADLRYVYLSKADLEDADLHGAELVHADLSFTSLWEAILSLSNLKGANLRFSNFFRTNCRNANLSGADLRGARARQSQMNSANGNAATRLPEGLTHPPHWLEEQEDPE